ncbi:DUF429 domain-containing protein [Blastococcus goldschmidtiae]|uniref:DUF429 domain-containing protein n=1 Tax=Blastococcus goldschmidtiae TaxID=3075546 RepID=A0ABU2K6S0_9ACTN|nr:DUF429 domain-containing protein [Blastococcus sp. DSM 46792]MDT0275887.1 DUF429 domain-containing protein [Blastococcus sp. DSM 46792]
MPTRTPPRAPSAQAFQLVKAIGQLDDALGDPPSDRVVEVHPELAFRELSGHAVTDPKVTARGTMQRLSALSAVMDVEDALTNAPRLVPMIDALDACAAAWSAARIQGAAASASAMARWTAAAARCGSAGDAQEPVTRRRIESGSTRSSPATGRHGHSGT